MTTTTLQQRFSELADYLRTATLERVTEVDAMIRCAIAGRHLLLLGPPGTAKSMLVDHFAAAIDASSFSYLLTRYTEPAELFGPIDVRLMASEGRLKRRTAGYLPEAEIVFLDEAFKANSAILNTMLGVLNERQIVDDGVRQSLPLRFALLASNEIPEIDDHSVGAFYDRVLVRLQVRPLEHVDNFAAMVRRQLQAKTIGPLMTVDDLDAAREQSRALPLNDGAIAALFAIRAELQKVGVVVSDRRWSEVCDYLRAGAWLDGADEVDVQHISAATCCLWTRPDQIPLIESLMQKHAPSWEADVRALRAVLAEQDAAIVKAKGIASMKDRMTALGDAGAVLEELKADAEKIAAKSTKAGDVVRAVLAEIVEAENTIIAAAAGGRQRKAV